MRSPELPIILAIVMGIFGAVLITCLQLTIMHHSVGRSATVGVVPGGLLFGTFGKNVGLCIQGKKSALQPLVLQILGIALVFFMHTSG